MLGRFRLKENVAYKLTDKNGKAKKIFQPNALFAWLLKKGVVSPTSLKVPFLFGSWTENALISNLVVSAGKALVAGRINGSGTPAAATFIALGIGTTAANAADTALESEIVTNGGQRAAATVSLQTTDTTNDTARLTHTFTFTGSFAVTESGVLNDATTGTLLSRQVFSAINVASGDSLAITWDFDVD